MPVEYLDPSIANEGQSANNWTPGAWANVQNPADDEWQPDLEPPHITDYAAFKKHKHYGRYFRPYRKVTFPALVYHSALGEKLVKTREEVIALGPSWTPFIPFWDHATLGRKMIHSEAERDELGAGWTPAIFDTAEHKWRKRVDMTGKTLPVKSETQRLAEVVAQALAAKENGGGVDPAVIAATVAAVMAALGKSPAPEAPKQEVETPAGELAFDAGRRQSPDAETERKALLELAEKEGIEVDKRWGNARIKKELGLD